MPRSDGKNAPGSNLPGSDVPCGDLPGGDVPGSDDSGDGKGATVVRVRFVAAFSHALDIAPGEAPEFRLPAAARYEDLVRAIEERFGRGLPANSLDPGAGRFHRHVAVLQDGVELHAPDDPLRDGATLSIGTRIYNRENPGHWAGVADAARPHEES